MSGGENILTYDEKVEMLRLADDIAGAEILELDTMQSQIITRALRIAGDLAAPPSGNAGERVEPVAWRHRYGSQWLYRSSPPNDSQGKYEPLYAAPPQPAPDAMREAAIQECIEIAQRYDDCGVPFIIEKLQELRLSPSPSGEPLAGDGGAVVGQTRGSQ